jgi:hypothetical protein
MIGWSDLPQCKPFEPLGLTCLDMFKQVEFSPLGTSPRVHRLRRGDCPVDDPLPACVQVL